jgi:hypothetical protein
MPVFLITPLNNANSFNQVMKIYCTDIVLSVLKYHSKIFKIKYMSVINDLLNSPKELLNSVDTTSSNTGRIVSAISGMAIIGMAMMDKKGSSLSKWIKIGSGAVLILKAVSGLRPVNKAIGVSHN